jgi:hypothetical protein
VQLPLGRLTDAELGILIETDERIVGCERAADALVHHGEAVI